MVDIFQYTSSNRKFTIKNKSINQIKNINHVKKLGLDLMNS